MGKKSLTKLKHKTPFRQVRLWTKLSKNFIFLGLLIAITLLVIFLNFEPNTFLSGWDNLHPEFNPELDLKRGLFSVWQEYRGTGLLGGMAHAADLPRVLLIYTLSLFQVPLNLIRYLTHFLPLLLGPVGVYLLLQRHVFSEKLDLKSVETASFLGGLYYLFNLSTLQTFFIPFETFTWLYGFLPLLIFFLINYLKKPTIGRVLTLFFVSLISSPAFYVETIFIVFLLTITPFIFQFIKNSKSHLKSSGTSLLATITILLPNLYWLLPIIFFVFTNGHVATTNRINIISSPETYARNLEFASLKDLSQLKGYLFKYLDQDSNHKYEPLLSTWNNHLNQPIINTIGFIFFLTIIMGIYFGLKKNIPWASSFLSVLLICYFFLLGGGLLINGSLPLVGELFRSPFTKFSIPLSLCYSFFFAIGTVFLLDLFTFLHTRLTYNLTLFSVCLGLLLYMSPAFSGNLINKNMKVNIPDEYFQLFSYMDQQDPSGRIANFPQNTFWGWNYYNWNYRGSGFLWYGLKQPLLDRAFDVWEKTSQNYYEEVSTAIFSQDETAFESALAKYGVTWILLDKNVLGSESQTSLGTDTLEKFLLDTNRYTLNKSFNDQIFLYKTKTSESIQNFLKVETILPTNPLLDFSLRPNASWSEKAGFLNQTTEINNQKSILIPSLSDSEEILPYKIEYKKNNTLLTIRFTPITPTFFVNEEQVDLQTTPQTVTIPVSGDSKNFIVNLNSQYFSFELPSEINDFTNFYPLTETYLPTQKVFDFGLYSGIATDYFPLNNSFGKAIPKQCYTQKANRKIEKIISPNSFTLLGTDVVGCLSATLPNIDPNQLLSVAFTYYSPTITTANVNITNQDYGTQNISQPLDPSNTPKRARLFSKPSQENKQINLILEAEGTKSIQEITYKDIFLTTHNPIFEATIGLNKIPKKQISLKQEKNHFQISLPVTKTQFDIRQISTSNSLFPEDKNCDQFNKGKTIKLVNSDRILYQSQNAIQCDFLNLRHFNHSLNYIIGINATNQSGLNLTTCLENHSTRRCDVFERLGDLNTTQYLIQPISSSSETPGYTLHLFNQSIGNRITSNQLTSLTIQPFPLNFLKNIEVNTIVGETKQQETQITSTHPAEFLYIVNVENKNTNNNLSLLQTKSEYWKAYLLPKEYKNLNPWQLTLKLLINNKQLSQLEIVSDSKNWYNSWKLPQDSSFIVLVYIPQYLEFFGLTAIPITSLTLLIVLFINHLHKKP